MGDALVRWLLWSSGAGLVLGALVGLARKHFSWAMYGAIAPSATVALVAGLVAAVRPVREAVADQQEQACRASGRAICSAYAFTAACAEATREPGRSALGEPQQKLCDGQGCTFRWVYVGPFRPETYPASATLLCSVVADVAGKGVRYALLRGEEAR